MTLFLFDIDGTLIQSGRAGLRGMRVWRITSPSVNLKQLEVTATVRWGFGGAMAPASTVTALKTWPF